ncbi:SgcJ/EcaC family oxidoreductase [Cupriavidus sp. UGS-1]|uniref:YybH family protein n=1 Tax=Cupriavidus sp. UGS-1 TaxID=2899826 RepID=UPI001E575F1E|nr:SgcJ/EcaC family oxidoreductase [Cupriavidus sp. UGS-1]MCD9119712.1 SgcJ/EcaC family oxidoreductase [Cupriavidus sp. UGS-1]
MSISKDQQTDERTIRQMMEDWARALERRDAAAMTAHYAPDVALFDVKPPYALRGVDAYRATWEACFPYLPRRFRSERKDIVLTVGADLAFCHCLSRLAPVDEPDHPAGGTWIRITVCLQKRDGRWLVVHEHGSLPFDPMTEKVVYIGDTEAETAA